MVNIPAAEICVSNSWKPRLAIKDWRELRPRAWSIKNGAIIRAEVVSHTSMYYIVFSSASRRVLWSIWNRSRCFRRILVIFSFEYLIEIQDYTRVCLKNRLLIQQLGFLSVFRIHHFVRIKAAILVMGKPTVDMDMKVSVSTYSRK